MSKKKSKSSSAWQDTFYYAKLPQLPKGVKWPVKMMDAICTKPGYVHVYCHCDNKHWLKRKPVTRACFEADVEWASAEQQNESAGQSKRLCEEKTARPKRKHVNSKNEKTKKQTKASCTNKNSDCMTKEIVKERFNTNTVTAIENLIDTGSKLTPQLDSNEKDDVPEEIHVSDSNGPGESIVADKDKPEETIASAKILPEETIKSDNFVHEDSIVSDSVCKEIFETDLNEEHESVTKDMPKIHVISSSENAQSDLNYINKDSDNNVSEDSIILHANYDANGNVSLVNYDNQVPEETIVVSGSKSNVYGSDNDVPEETILSDNDCNVDESDNDVPEETIVSGRKSNVYGSDNDVPEETILSEKDCNVDESDKYVAKKYIVNDSEIPDRRVELDFNRPTSVI